MGLLRALSGGRPRGLGVHDGRLARCPASPNCVCSDAAERRPAIAPYHLAMEATAAWAEVRRAVQALPRTRIITETDDYLHAECASRLLGFVDDLELHLRAERKSIAVRSASRLGYSDLGVNRERVESLRATLRERGVVD